MKKLFIMLCALLIGGVCYGGYFYLFGSESDLHEITENIKWQSTSNKQIRKYHVKDEIATGTGSQAIGMKLVSIKGVQAVMSCSPEQPLTPYCFAVTLSPLYSWSAVDTRIASIIDDVKNMKDYLESAQQPQPPEGHREES